MTSTIARGISTDEELTARYHILTDEEVAEADFEHRTEGGVSIMTGLHCGIVDDPQYPVSLFIAMNYGGSEGSGHCSMPLSPDTARGLAGALLRAACVLDARARQ